MGMLDRYRKAGGFIQLLQLIETCGAAKQAKLLGMIDDEDPRWSNAIKQRMLTVEDIFRWPPEIVAEIVNQIQELTLAFALKGLGDEISNTALVTMSHRQKRRLFDLTDGRNVSGGEISAAYSRIIEEVRSQINNGYLKLKDFDEARVVNENIEELLDNQSIPMDGDSLETSGEDLVFDLPGSSTDADLNDDSTNELQKQINRLKNEVTALKRENNSLKNHVSEQKDKIGKIKKLLAA